MFHCTRVKERGLNVRYRGISLLNVVGKIYAGILADRIQSDWGFHNEQGGFRAWRECVDQIFILKQIGEKAQKKKCRVYVDFIDLEKAYDRFNRKALWHVLRMYDVEDKLLGKIKNMYVNSSACVRIKRDESE